MLNKSTGAPVLVLKVYENNDLGSQAQDYFLSGYDPLVSIGIKRLGYGDWVAIPMSMIDELIIKLRQIKKESS